VPVDNFHRSLILIAAAGAGGTGWPAAPLLFNPVDPVTLLERGYAVFTFGQGGTVPQNGGRIDSNPDSGSGIFWDEPPARPWEENYDGLVAYSRFATLDEGVETTLPSDFSLTFFDGEEVTVPFGDPRFFVGSIHTEPEIISDTVIFAKNLVRSVFPCGVDWAAYVGWSGSGRAAVLINSNTRFGAFQVNKAAGPQAGGGGYNKWGDPSSGLRYDAFLSYAGANDSQGYLDQPLFSGFPTDVNPKLPISAPMVWLVPEGDVTLPQTAAYAYANRVWRALDALGRGSEIDQYMRIYSIPGATHQARDQLFTATDSSDGEGGLWYDYQTQLPHPGAFNQSRRGLRVSDAYAQAIPFNGPADGWDFFFHGKAGIPRDTPLWLQILAELRAGRQLPPSRVDSRLFTNVDAITTETRLPMYPTVEWIDPDPLTDEAFTQKVETLRQSITVDTGTASLGLEQHQVDDVKMFAKQNPLARSLTPLLLPEVAAPTGVHLFFFDLIFETPFSDEQLRTRYGSHDGYVKAYRDATDALVKDHLWDEQLGAVYLQQAADSTILR
jgi:hypothetical protein